MSHPALPKKTLRTIALILMEQGKTLDQCVADRAQLLADMARDRAVTGQQLDDAVYPAVVDELQKYLLAREGYLELISQVCEAYEASEEEEEEEEAKAEEEE